MKKQFIGVWLITAVLGLTGSVFASQEYVVSIKDHRFAPAELTIPANTRVSLLVKNLDPTPEEFESHALHREKIIQGNSTAVIHLGPLKPGRYPFFGEFHEESARGLIIVE